jgi:hypothetical protein
MKNILILTCTSFLLLSFNSGGYDKAMKETLGTMKNVQSSMDLVNTANKFERIATAEKDKWLPYYYQAYCYVLAYAMDGDATKTDGYLDIADANIATADKLKGDDVELLTLKGFSAMMRISVDPASRGQEYSMKAVGYLQQASQIDNKNPRVMLMLGQMQFGTAQFFGSDTAPICEQFRKASESFDSDAEITDPLWPSWGKEQALSMLKKCEG